ncbi:MULTISPECIES: hypothetical protein [Clostridia]|uniref:hypothetical protein n=1 Tax=Clostridia TaxID=186801 RepID=UPI00156ED072|nr:hypothetical protein [Blautia faecis]MCB5432066.1 hypothetical protein [Blautia faecis]MCG4846075.1 hypothetical protein [Blautia faecis]NSG92937.1 hypothetical protein [Blautia faecis]
MKRRYLAVLMGIMVATTSVPAMVYAEDSKTETAADAANDESGEADASDENGDESQENVVLGEVKSVSDSEITIAVGTMKEMGQPGGDGQNGGAPDGNGQGGEAPSMLDLTGEEQTITITADTVITKQAGGMQPGGDGQNGGAPEKPEGDGQNSDSSDGASDSQDAADDNQESENTDSQDGEEPEKPDGNGQSAEAAEISLSDIQEGDIVSITLDEDGNAASITVMSMEMDGQGQPGGDEQGAPGQGGPGGQSQGVDSYTAINEYIEDTTVSNETIESTGTDENAALISSGANVTLDNDTITRTSADSQGGDNSSFYGVGAAVLATDGTAYVKDGSVTTDAAGGAGLFAYDDGTVYASGTTVKTTQDTSGGVHVAGGGTLYGWDLDVETNGESSAAIRSDRGGGTMVIDGGNYVSNGVGSPAIYSTADIAVSNASLTANGSEAVCIEGLNSIHLYDCDLTGNMSDLDQNDNTWTVILYQSMSGDSEVGNSTFQMDGGSLTSENDGVFYTTNTESTITLNNVDINYNDDNEFFLQCTGNTNQRGWGQSGVNGADCHFTGISQDMQGDVIWDSISDLDFYLTEGSSLTGAVVDDESYAGEGGEGYCNVYVSADSTWTVTGDSTVSSLENEGTIVDGNGKTVTIQGTDGTVYVQGDSEYTITTGSYSDTADMSGATAIQDQSVYTVEKPDQL